MAKSRSYGGYIITLLVLAALGYGGWYYWNKNSDKDPEYSIVKVTRGGIVQSITATGTLQTISSIDVSTLVSGTVLEVDADFNDHVKKDQVLVKIDPSTYQQKLEQAKANLVATEAATAKAREDTKRSKVLFDQKLIDQSDYDTAVATLAQAEANSVSMKANVTNAQTDLDHCTITAPIDGLVLNRLTDPGRTVNANQSSPVLFTIINDLTKLQISAAVSEADIGSAVEGQTVNFQVDAYPNRRFFGKVSQVRNAATTVSSVVTYAVMIDVANDDLKLKPGMTANVAIVIAQRSGVPVVANSALRVRIPDELLEAAKKAIPAAATVAAVPMTDEEKAGAQQDILVQAGLANGAPPTKEAIAKAMQLAKDKGLDMAFINVVVANAARAAGAGGAGGGGGGGGAGGGRRGGGAGGGRNSGVGINVSNTPRTLYKLVDALTGKKYPLPVTVHLGISDGQFTEILDGAAEGDTLITYVTMPGSAADIKGAAGAPGASNNPFQQPGGRGGGGGGGFGGGGGGGRGGF